MNPLEVSAMFAAYVWFTDREGGAVKHQKAAEAFARENWSAFLPSAREGLGRLLIRVARAPKRGRRSRRKMANSVVG